MGNARIPILPDDLDGLRILGLGRIPRCVDCPRYEALVEAHDRSSTLPAILPLVPENCAFQVCAPLVHRYTRSSDDREPVTRAAAGM